MDRLCCSENWDTSGKLLVAMYVRMLRTMIAIPSSSQFRANLCSSRRKLACVPVEGLK